PFALRHMATELKSGIGLYRTLQAIASADYGVLSQEFSQTINEIEEGTDAQDALRHLALRTQSRALRTALTQIIRALRTGGNLSEVMNNIAEDVSFELQQKTKEFAEKMNFFGVIFIFMAIVLPVFVAILGSIRNAPLGQGGSMFAGLPLDPTMIMLFYLVLMPLILCYLVFYLKISQPKS
ncbi:MAG: type II secretion system F family protein, partial [Candidatus Diapherotrites archaeon]|nr:type II secretion system F family protein [Candidatus Diapherotrites archaeon]